MPVGESNLPPRAPSRLNRRRAPLAQNLQSGPSSWIAHLLRPHQEVAPLSVLQRRVSELRNGLIRSRSELYVARQQLRTSHEASARIQRTALELAQQQTASAPSVPNYIRTQWDLIAPLLLVGENHDAQVLDFILVTAVNAVLYRLSTSDEKPQIRASIVHRLDSWLDRLSSLDDLLTLDDPLLRGAASPPPDYSSPSYDSPSPPPDYYLHEDDFLGNHALQEPHHVAPEPAVVPDLSDPPIVQEVPTEEGLPVVPPALLAVQRVPGLQELHDLPEAIVPSLPLSHGARSPLPLLPPLLSSDRLEDGDAELSDQETPTTPRSSPTLTATPAAL